jgi:hypothetical protein
MKLIYAGDPYINHFAQADTIIPGAGSSQAWDRYAYAMNNPIRYIDPTGHMCSDPEDPTSTCDSGNHGGGLPPADELTTPPTTSGEYMIIISEDTIIIGTPSEPGEYVNGYCSGGGSPNTFVTAGFYADEDKGLPGIGGRNATLNYNATLGVEVYENLTRINVKEYYTFMLSEHSEDYLAYSQINFGTVGGESYQSTLGSFEISPRATIVNDTPILIFGSGSRPTNLHIKIVMQIENTNIATAALSPFLFTNGLINCP